MSFTSNNVFGKLVTLDGTQRAERVLGELDFPDCVTDSGAFGDSDTDVPLRAGLEGTYSQGLSCRMQ